MSFERSPKRTSLPFIASSSRIRAKRGESCHHISMTEDGAGKMPPGTENGDKVPEDLLPAPKIDLVPDVIEDIVSFKTNLALNPTLRPFQDPSAFKKCKKYQAS